MFGLTSSDVSIAIAFIALGGVLLSTLATASRAGKSKYIDIIAAERIRWVDQLRKDFAEFHDLVFRNQLAQKCGEDEEAVKTSVELARLAGLIDLKLNFAAELDRAIVRTMRRCMRSEGAREKGQIEALGTDVVNLRILVRYLLKDEWDKARVEASGFFGRLSINRKRRRRRTRILTEIKKLPAKLAEFHD